MKKLLNAFMAASLLGGATSLLSINYAYAQAGTGELRGQIKDSKTGEGIVGATVVATSPVLQGEQVVITEDGGTYYLTALPPGMYTLTVYYNEVQTTRPNVLIQLGKEAVVNVPFNTSAGKGETIVIKGRAPTVDQGSTKTGISFTKEYTTNLAVGRTFGAVVGAAAGAQGDTYGTSVSGATSAENVYIVEGINTTDTGFGTQSSNLPNEFIGETEIITGGYNAEYGRATGGIINVTTKQGSNEFHGTVFAYLSPGALTASANRILREGRSIDSETNRDLNWDVGAEIGGPIIKDKLWFHVGFNPSFTKSTTTRIVTSNVDTDEDPNGMAGNTDGDGEADIDPNTGFAIREEVERRNLKTTSRTAFFTAKINGAVSANHQFQVSGWGNPASLTGPFAVGRDPNALIDTTESGAYDVAAKWTSKLNGGKTQFDIVAGYHNGFTNEKPAAGQDVPVVRYEYERSLYDFANLENGIDACNDNDPNDKYKNLTNCAVTDYSTGGPGFLENRKNNRASIVLSATQRVKALGTHVFKAGFDAEMSTYNSGRRYSGGAFITRAQDDTDAGTSGSFLIREYLQYDTAGTTMCGADPDGDGVGNSTCRITAGLNADTGNRSLGAYLQDSWQVRPNFTINAGLRWEQQIGYTAEYLQGTTAPDTGEVIPKEAFRFDALFAPRIGFIYDPTNEGRAKIFGHWGRFYESVPLDINVRAFGGEITNERTVGTDADGNFDDSCKFDHNSPGDLAAQVRACNAAAGQSSQLGGAVSYFAPGSKGQYTQELILGTEYELMSNFKMGVAYTNRTLPVILEDMSTDGATNYFIGNPGEDYSGEAAKLEAQAMALPDSDPFKQLYTDRASWLRATKKFDKPSRNYDSVAFTATQRPTAKSLLIASYTYSKARGNYPGLFSTETNQLDPNLTSMYDLPDLMANRYGATGLDRPHLFKVDASYAVGPVVLGASARAQSGLPINALVGHPLYGQGESFLLSRGSLGRAPMTYGLDTHLAFGHNLGKQRRIEAFIDIFNLFNSQRQTDLDEIYSVQNAFPIVGGDADDLAHAKRVNLPRNTAEVITLNKNYGKTNAIQAPLSGRLGIRFTF
jgi:outer membrane receptor protein involved in Fe transport